MVINWAKFNIEAKYGAMLHDPVEWVRQVD